jgi:Arc/MetJ-type ribon-helix-helix transcriptional regulator
MCLYHYCHMNYHILYDSVRKLKNKQKTQDLSKIWLLVPKNFLEQFDTATKNTHTSRSEAIRYAMQLTFKEIKQQKTHTPKTQPLSSQPNTTLTTTQLKIRRTPT